MAILATASAAMAAAAVSALNTTYTCGELLSMACGTSSEVCGGQCAGNVVQASCQDGCAYNIPGYTLQCTPDACSNSPFSFLGLTLGASIAALVGIVLTVLLPFIICCCCCCPCCAPLAAALACGACCDKRRPPQPQQNSGQQVILLQQQHLQALPVERVVVIMVMEGQGG